MRDTALLEDFARKSGFRKFYKKNRPYYQSLIATYNQLNPIQKMQTWLDRKFGFGHGAYAVYFSPLVDGAHATTKLGDNGFNQTLMFICKAEMDTRYSPIINELLESRIVFTEIDHNYVNPVSDGKIEQIKKSFSNRNIWAKGDVTAAYTDPYKVFNEYMTFAVYSLYINDNYSSKEIEAYLPMLGDQMEKNRGFIKFKDFNRAMLEKYRQNPNLEIADLYDYMLKWAKNQNDSAGAS